LIQKALMLSCALAVVAVPAAAQETPRAMVDSYSALADSILALRAAEDAFVRSLLDGHYHAAEAVMKAGEWDAAAAHMALFANEGDNAVAGVRKRLVEGGHHHNAAGEEQGLYDEGFVVVTREARKKILEVASELRRAQDEAARKQAWTRFGELAQGVLSE
jgi:hypothetical protein